MARPKSLSSMSVEALINLRDEISATLSSRAADLQRQLARLTGTAAPTQKRSASRGPTKGSKVAPKYRGPNGETWTGRGLKPRWLTAQLAEGKTVEDFAIGPAGTKASRKK